MTSPIRKADTPAPSPVEELVAPKRHSLYEFLEPAPLGIVRAYSVRAKVPVLAQMTDETPAVVKCATKCYSLEQFCEDMQKITAERVSKAANEALHKSLEKR